jgi:hypothetical protein
MMHDKTYPYALPFHRSFSGPTIYTYLVFLSICFLTSCTNDSSGRMPYIHCGGGIQFTCPIDMYCKLGEDCGGIDNKGHCAPIPRDCDVHESRVCGCDDKEYQNECIARTLGVTIKNDGDCIRSPKFIK